MSNLSGVCPHHFDDPYLADLVHAEVDRVGGASPACTICLAADRGEPGAELDRIAEVVEDGLRRFYAEGEDWWGGFIDTRDVLNDLGGIDDDAIDLLVPAIGDRDWEPAVSSGHDEVEQLHFGWEAFEYHVRHVSRYLLDSGSVREPDEAGPWLRPSEVLPAIAEAIRAEGKLVALIDQGTQIFRARTFNSGEPFAELHELVSPPPEKAAQGRMNAAGIPVLYAALDAATAVAEVFDGKTSAAVVTLSPLRDLTVLDLTSIPSMSAYDPATDARRFSMLGFLRGFARTIATPIIRDDRVHHEYAPTQMASEFFHWRLLPTGEGLDGILYPSSRGSGRNMVLFVGQEECLADEYLRDGQDRGPGRWQILASDPIAKVVIYEPPKASPGGVLRLVSEAGIAKVF